MAVIGSTLSAAQYLSLSRLRMRNIFRDIPFWAIVVLLVAFGVNNGYFAGRVAEQNLWPVTYLMVQAVEGSALLFLFIVAALYAAELWREGDTHFDGIHDALPMQDKLGVSNALDHPYPDTRMLVDAIRAQTPPELQYLVDDGFNRIVLYDNRAVSATSQKTPDGKYKATLEVQSHKAQADGNGAETPMPLADYIEIGVFSGKKDEEKPLYLKKEKFTEEHRTFEIIVDEQPTLAGIDPYNKLIDRNADDNMIDITKH